MLQQSNRGDPRPSGGPDGGVPQPCGGTGSRSVRAQPDLGCAQLRPSSTQHLNNDLRHSVSRIDGRRRLASENAKKHVRCPDGQRQPVSCWRHVLHGPPAAGLPPLPPGERIACDRNFSRREKKFAVGRNPGKGEGNRERNHSDLSRPDQRDGSRRHGSTPQHGK